MNQLQAVINSYTQFFTWLEIRHVLTTQIHCITSLGIAAYAGCAVVKLEATKATDFSALVGNQCMGHAL
jgi:hypothetical protein